ncbi:hypothetical protein PV327_007471 [Microctonus hyperodae]|uniref:Kinesin heavy chain n=1 Tax=Microctonus hyperodae TaxID=165561 RepID=A0AA39FZH6_MICHY|nr:hypothetical protein PV327_007471 [Microctonus hyperodae]
MATKMNTLKHKINATEDNIKVVCRFRPINKSEKTINSKFIVKFPTNDDENYVSIGSKVYAFDKIFKPDATQDEIYIETAKPIVTDVLNGCNGTIFAYGQTSSGKTYTMVGDIENVEKKGIIPRIVNDIFNHISNFEKKKIFHIKVSYYEIYMNKIIDLLDVSKIDLRVHEDENRVTYVKGVTERHVINSEELFKIIDEGQANRHIVATKMNECSSRAHSVFSININQENVDNKQKLSGKLYLVDLAGLERVAKTNAEGTVLNEAKNINKSLLALGNVISALTDGSKTHIPYRDSKLTRILQESLGGNARTTIIICCSPASFNESETKSALNFGNRAKSIKNNICINENLTVAEWCRRYNCEKNKVARLQGKIEKLKAELIRWRRGEIVPPEAQVNFDDSFDLLISGQAEIDEKKYSMTIIPNNDKRIDAIFLNEEREKMKKEYENLYKEIDEKNKLINRQSKYIDELTNQMKDQDKLISSACDNYEEIINELCCFGLETKYVVGEVQNAVESLEKLSSIDSSNKSQEIEILNKSLQAEFDEHLDKQIDVNVVDNVNLNISADSHEKLEELYANVNLFTNKIKSVTKYLAQRCHNWDAVYYDYTNQILEIKNMLDKYQQPVSITKNKNTALDKIDVIRKQYDKFKFTQQNQIVDMRNRRISTQTYVVNKKKKTHLSSKASHQVNSTKIKLVDELHNLNDKFHLVHQQMQTTYELSRVEGLEKLNKIEELILMNERRLQDNNKLLIDNSKLRCEQQELKSKLLESTEKIEDLKKKLYHSENNAKMDRLRYHYIVNQTREELKQKDLILREQIAKSIPLDNHLEQNGNRDFSDQDSCIQLVMSSYTFKQRTLAPIPPEKGSFPLDHEGFCKRSMIKYMRCLYDNKNSNTLCRDVAKEYLGCRMDNNLMTREEWSKLGFTDEDKKSIS